MILGCVADDFTGASDAASFLQAGGANVILSNGIPEREDEDILEAQAVVIALKTRTCPPGEAVDRSMAAFSWLKAHGARMLYFKYCSTFDSTENGNIGPVLDAALERWDIPYTLLCPALLENGRSVKDGKLYVNGVLLEDSPMKDHPLNPMRDSRLKYLMERQSRYPCFNLGEGELERGFRPYEKPGHYYLIPDYYEEKHGRMIAKQYGNLPLLSGGSGLLRMIARTWEPDEERNVFTPVVRPLSYWLEAVLRLPGHKSGIMSQRAVLLCVSIPSGLCRASRQWNTSGHSWKKIKIRQRWCTLQRRLMR